MTMNFTRQTGTKQAWHFLSNRLRIKSSFHIWPFLMQTSMNFAKFLIFISLIFLIYPLSQIQWQIRKNWWLFMRKQRTLCTIETWLLLISWSFKFYLTLSLFINLRYVYRIYNSYLWRHWLDRHLLRLIIIN